MRREKDWYKLKRYPHIGLPLKLRHRGWVEDYITVPENIASHSFFPFIHRKLSVRKFRRAKNNDGTKSLERIESYKDREVFYASHLDSMIFAYYSQLITAAYEKKLKSAGLQDCVTAYRSVPLNPHSKVSRNKCNVDFANDVFSYIKVNNRRKLVAITFDITSFFDNLNHKRLKDVWAKILDMPRLPDDHYAIFRNLTKFSYVEFEEIFDLFKDEILVEKAGRVTKQKVPNTNLLKEKNAVAFCKTKDFNNKIRNNNLIKNNKYHSKADYTAGILRKKGIPQGSPISATLANIYLFDFDSFVNDFITLKGGIYRRYSDDMVVVIDEMYLHEIHSLLINEIKNYELEIQPSKSQVFYFKKFDGKYGCKELNQYTDELSANTKFEYLGFAFDGQTVSLKCSGLSKFYRKMKRSIRRGGFYAKYGKNQKPVLFKNRLYKRFTAVGAHRREVIKPLRGMPGKYIKTGEYDWGNYLTYANLGLNVFSDSIIKRQIRNHWNKFHQLMKTKETEINRFYTRKKKPLS
jgi:hypothetical protein